MYFQKRIKIDRIIAGLVFFSIFFNSAGQTAIDSLKGLYSLANHDTVRADLLISLGNEYKKTDENILLDYNSKCRVMCERNLSNPSLKLREKAVFTDLLLFALNNISSVLLDKERYKESLELRILCAELSEKNKDTLKWAYSLINVGVNYNYMDKNNEAFSNFEKGIELLTLIHNEYGVATAHLNLSTIYDSRSLIVKALYHLDIAEKTLTRIGDKSKLASCYNQKGYIYQKMGEITQGRECFQKSLQLHKDLNDKRSQANDLNNIGYTYSKTGDKKSALEYYQQCIAIATETQEKRRLAGTYSNIGTIFLDSGEYEKADEYFSLSLKYSKEIDRPEGIVTALTGCAKLNFQRKKYKEAKNDLEQALSIAKKINLPESISSVAKLLSQVYKTTGDHKNALETFELHIKMRDSISSIENKKASIKNQLKNEYEKEALADSVAHAKESEIKSVELNRQSAEIKVKKNQQVALFGGLFLVTLFAGFMFNRFKVTQRQKEIIEKQKTFVEEQKQLVVEKQKEIVDSIHYAKRIQNALIPNEKMVEKHLARLKGKF